VSLDAATGPLLDRARLDEAVAIVRRSFGPTPQQAWPLLSAEVGVEVWAKHEDATPTGAFKVRGGLVYVDRLRRERPHVAGLVSATRGNHGQSLAFAGRSAGVPVTIVVPHGNSTEKNAAMAGFGAEVVEHGADFQEALEHAAGLAAERGFELVPPFHPDLVAGVATYALELFEAAGELDVVYVAVGMGSGINGLIAVRDLLGLRTQIVGVVSEGAPATARSFAARRPVATERARTFVDGVATRTPDPGALAAIYDGAAAIVEVSDDAVAEAMRLLYRTTHHLAEPAGAIALAGLLADHPSRGGERIAFVLSGANMDTPVAATVLAGGTPAP
jgi:threonine dehydratase